MIKKINCKDTEIIKILSLATAENKAEAAMDEYLRFPNRELYVKCCDNVIKGCIGIDISDEKFLTITHIAVLRAYQGQGVASEMISFVEKIYKPTKIIAETDSEAVVFYEKCGFEINSLGEKYPNVERFKCIFHK
ncbi:GNAT family N-acetyltransferase [Enterococcus sp. BWR-S5]|uniref:GNAT family N-acetyltransferase n=1 Tax=Enterococcus sp. BWR-S5 TaxID=2787714 RepID=UPI001923CBC0|nr:GNAT family N-acetyltransferase [Enterococcus sp. BWR-S5]MBL1226249.1 GNAT family N-acetyltransferase [Enterococcus sp. BWR-S5]